MTPFDALLICAALNVYNEARGEPLVAQYAVAIVTLNRAKHSRSNVCEVVFKPRQFSWTNTGGRFEPEPRAWRTSLAVARGALTAPDFTGGAQFYHRHDVYPHWARDMQISGRWGRHIFYSRPR